MRYLRPVVLSLLIPVLSLVSPGLSAQSSAETYKELKPAQPTRSGDKVEVLEVFFYGCVHCYNLEPFVRQWIETKPDNVAFYRMPIVFREDYKPLAQAFYTAEKMGVLDKVHEQLFSAIHKDRAQLFTEAPLKEFFVAQGINGDEFTRVYNSAEISTKVTQAEVMARRYMISSIPTVIVNGKYLTSPAMAGGQRELFTVIDQLVGKESH
ncbi:MAG: thiol:disulfide interchange protein DsbA/DsbL [Gammaproteobacteria bacterium]|jgi:thiol:disulfide interchange protein DsbA|nr:MAG: thiol:disulfide interchange protein DsbA/DsbL [Gammaproteobacteria bacterium]